ncbi:MAG: hypothetical protein QOI49_2740, partial [Verrucomicrobiota bacterium]
EAKRIDDPAWRKQLAESLCTGIESYRNLVEKKQRPMLVAEYRAQASSEITVVDLAAPPPKLDASPAPSVIPVTNPAPSPSAALTPDPYQEP